MLTVGTITTINYNGTMVKVEVLYTRPHTINWQNEVVGVMFLEEVTLFKGTVVEQVKEVGYRTTIEVAL